MGHLLTDLFMMKIEMKLLGYGLTVLLQSLRHSVSSSDLASLFSYISISEFGLCPVVCPVKRLTLS